MTVGQMQPQRIVMEYKGRDNNTKKSIIIKLPKCGEKRNNVENYDLSTSYEIEEKFIKLLVTPEYKLEKERKEREERQRKDGKEEEMGQEKERREGTIGDKTKKVENEKKTKKKRRAENEMKEKKKGNTKKNKRKKKKKNGQTGSKNVRYAG